MKKLLLIFLLLPTISFANELYMQCKWEDDIDIFEIHYSKKDGLNVVKGSYNKSREVNYKKNQCKVEGENLVCKKHESKIGKSDEYDNKPPQTKIDHTTTINRFTLDLNYNRTTIETIEGDNLDRKATSEKIKVPEIELKDVYRLKASCVEVKAKL